MKREAKLIECRHCGKQIAASAKTCPECGGKNKKPLYRRPWVYIVLVLILIGALGGNGGESSKKIGEVGTVQNTGVTASAEKESVKETVKETPAPMQTEYRVGDILHDQNLDIVYMASGEYKETNSFMQPKDGNRYIFLRFAFRNTSEKSDAGVSSFSFECYADGYACESYYGADDDLSATLSAGRMTTGCVYFEVPKDAQQIEVEYKSNFFRSEHLLFLYEGEQDSGYVPEANTEKTADAVKSGESAEIGSVRFTFLSCAEDKSYGYYSAPKAGCRYITCEFEVENIGSGEEYITMFSFDCYADGRSCESAYFRDDNLSATLSAGRKAKGTVTFEVPTDAEVVEVEYLDNAWSSSRLVFDANI